jgi:hypothetical protein
LIVKVTELSSYFDDFLQYESKSITPVDEYECTLSEELQKIALVELQETEEVRTNGIRAIRDWIMNNPRILKCRMDSKTKENIERYILFRQCLFGDEFFENLEETKKNMDTLLDNGAFYVFPKRDPLGRLILYERSCAADPNIPRIGMDGLTLGSMIVETLLEDEENQIRGMQYVMDFADITFRHYFIVPFSIWFWTAKNVEVTFFFSLQTQFTQICSSESYRCSPQRFPHFKCAPCTAIHRKNCPETYAQKAQSPSVLLLKI